MEHHDKPLSGVARLQDQNVTGDLQKHKATVVSNHWWRFVTLTASLGLGIDAYIVTSLYAISWLITYKQTVVCRVVRFRATQRKKHCSKDVICCSCQTRIDCEINGKFKVLTEVSWLLAAFTKLRKVIISFFVPVCLSACNNSATSGRILMKFGVCLFLLKLSRGFLLDFWPLKMVPVGFFRNVSMVLLLRAFMFNNWSIVYPVA